MEIKKKRIAKNISTLHKSYQLSALISADSFFYAFFDSEQLIESDQIKLSEFNRDGFIGTTRPSIDKALLGVHTDKFTIVPAKDYTLTSRNDLLRHALGNRLGDNDIIKADYNATIDAYICYGIDAGLYAQYKSLFADVQFHHIINTLISSVQSSSHHTIHLCRVLDQTVVIVVKDNRLKIANTIEGYRPMTILYYTTLIQQTLTNEGQKPIVQLSGDFHEGDGCARLLRRYFTFVKYQETSLTFNDLPLNSSVYFPLHSLSLCA